MLELRKLRPRRVNPSRRTKVSKDVLFQVLQTNAKMRQGKGDYIRLRMQALLVLLGMCGLRATEALTLPVEHVMLEERRIKVIGKGKKLRWAPLPPDAYEVLKVWLTTYHKGGAFVLDGFTYNAARLAFDRIIKHMGIDLTMHGLRRTAATLWVQEGMPLTYAQKLLGHSDLKTTQAYIEADVEDAVNWFHR